jgi:YidC/Oxa1 family membrane protein insertase
MDKRFFSFLIMAMAIMMGWQLLMRQMFPPPPPAPAAAQQDGEAKPGDAAKPADGAAQAEVKPAADPQPAAAVPQTASPPTWTTLGSLDHGGNYRMLVTLNNRGAAVERVELNNPRYHNVDNVHPLGGYLGHLAPMADSAAKGCRIQVVGPGTPAEQAGLKVGDVVTSINGTPTPDADAFVFELRKTKPEHTVKLEYNRDGKPQSVEVALRPYPLEVVHPEAPDREKPELVEPASFLLTLDKLDDVSLDIDIAELQGVEMRDAYWELLPKDAAKPNEAAFRRVLSEQGVEVVKRYTLMERDPAQKNDTAAAYTLGLKIEVKNVGSAPRKLAYRLDGPTGLPVEGFWYARGSKIGAESGCGMRDVVLGRWVGQNVDHGMFTCTTIADKEATVVTDPMLQYVGVDSQYFAAVLMPQPNGPADSRVSRLKAIAAGPVPTDSSLKQLTNVSFRLTSKPVEVAAGAAAPADEFKIYLGPKAPEMLAEYQLGPLVDYGWFDWVAEPMLAILHFCYRLVGNYGIAIIMLTIFVRLCMFPLSRKQALGAMKMQELQPEIKRIAEKYKTQPEQRMKAQQELFRKHNYNPFSGCMPIFIQLPIFIGLYRSLAVDVELRQAPLISENIRWASNLAAPDMFWYWQPYLPSFLASESGFLGPFLNLLPCVTIILFIVQQKMFMPPATDEQSAMQQKMMKYMMVFMGFMFFKVPAGLCVYFISSSIWSIAERKILPKPKPTEPIGQTVLNVESKSSSNDRKSRKR